MFGLKKDLFEKDPNEESRLHDFMKFAVEDEVGDTGQIVADITLPKIVNFDVQTNLEYGLKIATIFGGIAVAISFTAFYSLETFFHPINFLIFFIFVLLFTTYRNIKEDYILDFKKKSLIFKRKIFGKQTTKLVSPLSKIDAVVGSGCYRYAGINRLGFWEYRAELVLSTGKTIPIGNWYRDDVVPPNMLARKIADQIGANYYEGKFRRIAKPVRIQSKYGFKLVRRSLLDRFMEFFRIVIVLAIIFFIRRWCVLVNVV